LPTLAGRIGGGTLATHCDTAQVLHLDATTLVGQIREGGVASRLTVTVNVQVLRLVQLSVAMQVTVVLPNGKALPEGGVQTIPTLASQASVALTSKFTILEVSQVQTVMFVGQFTTGGVVS
jgi:hypothetical protein